jgi:hypothetical protein
MGAGVRNYASRSFAGAQARGAEAGGTVLVQARCSE